MSEEELDPALFDKLSGGPAVPPKVRLGGPRWLDVPSENADLPEDRIAQIQVDDPRMNFDASGVHLVLFDHDDGYRVLVRGSYAYLPEENFAFYSGPDNVVPEVLTVLQDATDRNISHEEAVERFEDIVGDLRGEVLSEEQVEEAYPALAELARKQGADR